MFSPLLLSSPSWDPTQPPSSCHAPRSVFMQMTTDRILGSTGQIPIMGCWRQTTYALLFLQADPSTLSDAGLLPPPGSDVHSNFLLTASLPACWAPAKSRDSPSLAAPWTFQALAQRVPSSLHAFSSHVFKPDTHSLSCLRRYREGIAYETLMLPPQ